MLQIDCKKCVNYATSLSNYPLYKDYVVTQTKISKVIKNFNSKHIKCDWRASKSYNIYIKVRVICWYSEAKGWE